MNMVHGELKNDCGVCCLATIMGVTWRCAAALIWRGHHSHIDTIGLIGKRSYSTTTRMLISTLKTCGYELIEGHLDKIGLPRLSRKRTWADITRVLVATDAHVSAIAVVNVRPRGPKKLGHWVLFRHDKVYDPQSEQVWHSHNAPWEPKGFFIVINPVG
jgi:hypothetical protein